jgi:hypothetical protein
LNSGSADRREFEQARIHPGLFLNRSSFALLPYHQLADSVQEAGHAHERILDDGDRVGIACRAAG